jgi:hypothetical protein
MSTIKVRLADVPTDVLVHLVDHGPATISTLAALAPEGTVESKAAVSYAIDLLRRMGLVQGNGATYRWAATDEGVKAVRDARAAAAATA